MKNEGNPKYTGPWAPRDLLNDRNLRFVLVPKAPVIPGQYPLWFTSRSGDPVALEFFPITNFRQVAMDEGWAEEVSFDSVWWHKMLPPKGEKDVDGA